MSSAFSSVEEAVELLDARQNTSTTWLARCPSCDRGRRLAISANPDQTVALCCQDACTDSAVDRAVNAIRNRTRAITATGTVTPSASPSGVGVGDPVLVSMAETATGTVPLPNGMVGVADPTPVSGAQTASGPFLEHPQATACADPTSVQLTGDQSGLPSDTVHADTERGYQWLSPLSEAEYAALRESIQSFGVMVPVVVDEDGVIIDGYHRVKVCRELGIDWPSTVLSGLTEAEKWDRARDLNDARRHLTARQRAEMLSTLNERMGGLSLRVRAGKLGLSRETVRRMDAQSASGLLSDTPEPEAFRSGTDGKRYRATRPRQGSTAGPTAGSVSVTVPEVDQSPPVSGDGLARVSVDTFVSTELVANSPDRDVSPPAAVRHTMFGTDDPPSMEISKPIGKKALKGTGTKAPGDVMARTTDPVIIAPTIFEWLGSTKTITLVGLLQELVRTDAKRMVPIPGQMTFV